MRELLTTNDPVLLSFASSLLKEEDVDYFVFDSNISIMEGSIGVFPRRLQVAGDDYQRARQILIDAGLTEYLRADDKG
jgi:hypothetical protein